MLQKLKSIGRTLKVELKVYQLFLKSERTPRLVLRLLFIIVAFLSIAIYGCSHLQKNEDIAFQTSTIRALLEGVYEGDITYKELKKHGDFGIGTFNNLDGEMVGLEGKFYQIKADGTAYSVQDSMKTPFAVVTFFKSDRSVTLDRSVDCKVLEQYLDTLLPTKNIFYAIKIDGDFIYLKARSIPMQNKPYVGLAEVVKNQKTFEFQNVKGTLAGFWFPGYMEGINVPGYHFHFITADKKAGGHLSDCRLKKGRIEVDYISQLFMALPENGGFYDVDLTKGKEGELERVEK
ncbi:MAG: acetolactate decarboxylase [Candidatus Dadabacteria bacterium]|nr:acetolactate decarboxylase [Candidatus Dadabacteria bacterium]